MKFDVASVKPSKPGSLFEASVSLDGLDGAAPTGNLFRANAPVHAYLLFAYKISDSVQARSIWDHLPSWAKPPQFFTIEARADGVPTRDQLRLMVQSLLVDRFKLRVHREMQMRDVYTLVRDRPDKLGPQLQPHSADNPCLNNPNATFAIAAPTRGTEGPHYCGMVVWDIDGEHHLRLTDVTMPQVANYLSGASMQAGTATPHSGVDRTGLTGRFDLDVQFVQEANGPGSNPDASGPNFASALKNQLGLKLVNGKAEVNVIVIDHLERPSSD